MDPSSLDLTEARIKEDQLEARLKTIMTNPRARLNTLYKVRNPLGQIVPFRMQAEQCTLFDELHYLNLIVKARQLGMTTFIQIFILDQCMFHPNTSAGVIAHTNDDAKRFFRDKIKFAYENLPNVVKELCPVIRPSNASLGNSGELLFANGSRITVSSSARSDTLQILHVSELGHMSVYNPQKANEVVTGSLNTLAPGQIVFIESTSEGPYGVLYDMAKRCMKKAERGDALTSMDYKLHFFPWFDCTRYTLNEPAYITEKNREYFEGLDEDYDISLSHGQQVWYIKKLDEQGENGMVKEFPSTLDEAFQGVTEGAVYGKQMRAARKERRIGRVPHVPGVPVNTFWDLGRRDMTAIWFHQRVGVENRWINYEEDHNQSLDYYARLLHDIKEEWGFLFGEHYLPHDVEITDLSRSDNLSRHDVLLSLGVKPIIKVDRIAHEEDGIEMMRQVFPTCYFDEKHCEKGIEALSSFRYEYDEKALVWKKVPKPDWTNHAADAIRQFAQGYRHSRYSLYDQPDENPLLRANRQRRTTSSRGRRLT